MSSTVFNQSRVVQACHLPNVHVQRHIHLALTTWAVRPAIVCQTLGPCPLSAWTTGGSVGIDLDGYRAHPVPSNFLGHMSAVTTVSMTTLADAPRNIHMDVVESDAAPAGVGETGVPSFAPALCNAIFAATGKRIRDLPIKNHDLSWS